jgi:flavin-binding protein dodecin
LHTAQAIHKNTATHYIEMNNPHLEHTDVIRVTGQSHTSFDDAVSSALKELASPSHGHNHHPGLIFKSFEVVKLGGFIHHNKADETCGVTHFKVTIDVEAAHDHGNNSDGHED